MQRRMDAPARGPSSVDVVAGLRALARDGSKAERRLAALVLGDLHLASKASIAELAGRAGVSEPTVTRFCRALACEGVRDFKFHVAQILAIGGLALYPEPAPREAREARVVDIVHGGAAAALDRVRDAVDMALVGAIADRLIAARRVLAYGSGGVSSMGAVELENRLFRLGLAANAHTDGQMQRMTAAVADEGTAVVAISASGHAASVIDAVRIATRYGATAICITAPGSPLARAAQLSLAFSIPGDGEVKKPSSGRYALLMIIDLLAMVIAEEMGDDVLERLRRIRTSLAGLDMTDPGRPIGD